MTTHIIIEDKASCCGCGACAAACPKNCISMKFDDEGFAYPSLDECCCIECGLCVQVCPLVADHASFGAKSVEIAYAATSTNEKARKISTSGGVFDAFVRATIERGGIVIGARFDEHFKVVHDLRTTVEGSTAFYGSKYVQSDLSANDVYRRAQNALKAGTWVLFSGTPCQVQALKMYLGKEYSNLITCDFVCRAVPAPLAWEVYLREMCAKYASAPKSVVFRNKTYGYHSGTMKIEFENGKAYYGSGRIDPMHKAFFANLISRPSCYKCPFRRTQRSSDFTIFDCWSYADLTGMHDDDLGHSHLWVHTNKGIALIPRLKNDLDLIEVDLDSVVATDGKMAVQDIRPNRSREAFLPYIYQHGFEAAVQRFIPVTIKDKAIEVAKGVLYKVGILSAFSKAKRSRRSKA